MSNPEPFSIKAVISAVILVMTMLTPGNAAQSSALSHLHREVIERLSALLLNSDRVNESVTLVRTLTNAYTEKELSARISSHGKNLISRLNQSGDTAEAVQWDQKIGHTLNAAFPGMWQSGSSLPAEAKTPAASSKDRTPNGGHPSKKRSVSPQKVRQTVQSLKTVAKPEDKEAKGNLNTQKKSAKPATILASALPVVPESESKSTSKSTLKSISKSESKSESKSRSKLKSKPITESKSKPKSEPKSEPKLKSISMSRLEVEPESRSISKSKSKPEAKPESKSKSKSKLKFKSRIESKPRLKPEPESTLISQSKSKSKPKSKLMPETWVTDKMGFPLSKPLFEPSFVTPKPNVGKISPDGIFISQESSNRLKDLKSNIVNLNFKDANIADIVLMLAEAGGFNIVSRNEIKGKTTITFNDIPVGTALDLILRTNNYTYQVRDDVIWIFRRGEEPICTKVFFVRNINVYEILPTIRRALGQEVGDTTDSRNEQFGHPAGSETDIGLSEKTADLQESNGAPESTVSVSGKGQSTGWSVYSDTPSNSLIVTASLAKLEEIARLLKVLDVGSTGYKLEERVFTLKYIDRDSFIKTIKMTLPKFDEAKQIIDVKRN